jgi:FixJ family two-component response regulator
MKGTVHVVDDDAQLRDTLVSVLTFRQFEAIPHESVERFIRDYEPRTPSVILVDMRMPVQSGLDLIRRARDGGISSPIVVISGESTAPEAVEAMKSGAVDFLFKPVPLAKILAVVESAMAHHLVQTENQCHRQQFLARYASLTPRERDLCPYVARDEKIKTIAAALNISQPTVKIHKSRILKKLNVETPAELALKMSEYGPSSRVSKGSSS